MLFCRLWSEQSTVYHFYLIDLHLQLIELTLFIILFLNIFSCFLSIFFFLVVACLAGALQPCMEWISIKKTVNENWINNMFKSFVAEGKPCTTDTKGKKEMNTKEHDCVSHSQGGILVGNITIWVSSFEKQKLLQFTRSISSTRIQQRTFIRESILNEIASKTISKDNTK